MKRETCYTMIVCVLALIACILAGPSATQAAQADERCFAETGFCISGRIREFWEENGGLAVFGFPITPLQQVTVARERIPMQWFERNSLELHYENRKPYDVLIGRVGADSLAAQQRDWRSFTVSTPLAGCRFFVETGHNLCGEFLRAWQSSGLEFDGARGTSAAESLALFGLPLSDIQIERVNDQEYQVQWFERARFELHPELTSPNNVLFGLLGNELQLIAHQHTTQCEGAFATINAPNTPGGYRIIAQYEQWPRKPWLESFDFADIVEPAGSGEAAVLCIKKQYVKVGEYTNGATAWRAEWHVRIFLVNSGEVRSARTFRGSPPPSMTRDMGGASGSEPIDDIRGWLKIMLQKP